MAPPTQIPSNPRGALGGLEPLGQQRSQQRGKSRPPYQLRGAPTWHKAQDRLWGQPRGLYTRHRPCPVAELPGRGRIAGRRGRATPPLPPKSALVVSEENLTVWLTLRRVGRMQGWATIRRQYPHSSIRQGTPTPEANRDAVWHNWGRTRGKGGNNKQIVSKSSMGEGGQGPEAPISWPS